MMLNMANTLSAKGIKTTTQQLSRFSNFLTPKDVIARYMDMDPNNPLLFKKKAFIEVQAYNRNLKLLAKRAKLVRALSNKTGRHTNAQMWIRFGADRPILS